MFEETIHDVKERLLASPSKSLRRLSQETNLPYSKRQRAAKKAKLRAYRVSCVQDGHTMDHEKSVQFCLWIKDFLTQNPGILDVTFFTDEARFHLSGYVNSQNTRIWATENPHTVHEEPLHSQKVGVWCGVSRRRIIGSILFEQRVTTEVYLQIFNEFANQLTDNELTTGYYQQDGATCHTSNASMREIESFLKTELSQKTFGHPDLPI